MNHKNRTLLKLQAKADLKGHWQRAAITGFEYWLIKAIIYCIFIYFLWRNYLQFILFGLWLPNTNGDIPMSSQVQAQQISANTHLLKLGCTVIFAILLMALTYSLYAFLQKRNNHYASFFEGFNKTAIGFAICKIGLYLVGYVMLIIPGILILIALSQGVYLITDAQINNHKIGVIGAMRSSLNLMHDHWWEYFVLELSLLGWNILSFCTFGIAGIWIKPYIIAVKAQYYHYLLFCYQAKLNQTPENKPRKYVVKSFAQSKINAPHYISDYEKDVLSDYAGESVGEYLNKRKLQIETDGLK